MIVAGRAAAISTQAFATMRLSIPEGWDWERRPYLEQLYNDRSREIVVEKATQVGVTIWALSRVVHGLKYRYNLGAVYYLPTQAEMSDLEKSKLRDLLRDARDLKPEDGGAEVENTRIKRIGRSLLYLRGTQSESGLRSISADCLVLDEMDSIEPRMRKLAFDRIAASPIKDVIELSRPTLPGWGIDARFQESDMKRWLTKCQACARWSDVASSFPDSVKEIQGDPPVSRLICPQCRESIDPLKGEWVAEHPDRELSGYHISQLIAPTTDLSALMREWRETPFKDVFHNSRLGLPFQAREGGFSAPEILKLCGKSEALFPVDNRDQPVVGSTAGLDQGKDLHLVITWAEQRWDQESREWVDAGKGRRQARLFVLREWEELDPILRRFSVWRLVVDALPETRNARKLQERFHGTVFLNYYVDSIKGLPVFDRLEGVVKSDRTLSLDASGEELREGRIILPMQNNLCEEFADHCKNSAKVLKEDRDGNRWYEWMRSGPDHFRHAHNYEWIGRSQGTGPPISLLR